jgi:hypothetical protein
MNVWPLKEKMIKMWEMKTASVTESDHTSDSETCVYWIYEATDGDSEDEFSHQQQMEITRYIPEK